jgi:hypothetical protein
MSNRQNLKAWQKAANTDHWTEILFRALSNRVAKRWRFVSFRGTSGSEWRGIVDVLGIRKDTAKSDHELLKSGDLFDVVLVQMKGGSAKPPTLAEIRRLRVVARKYRAKNVVLFSWRRGQGCSFKKLRGTQWLPSSAMELFSRGN